MTSDIQLLTARDVGKLLSLTSRSVRDLSRRKLLPSPLRLGVNGRCLRWRESDVERFVRERHESSD